MNLGEVFKQNPFRGPHNHETRLFFLTCFCAGAVLDFIFCGVFKIIWIAIYLPAYVAAGVGLVNSLESTRWSKVAYPASLSLILGALFVHVLSVGYSRQVTYQVAWTSSEPDTFSSPDWPQRVIVTSGALRIKLAADGQAPAPTAAATLPIQILETLDYGCIRSFQVDTIDGVDVRLDPSATWVWKSDKNSEPPSVGPGQEDRHLPWCLLKFYRYQSGR